MRETSYLLLWLRDRQVHGRKRQPVGLCRVEKSLGHLPGSDASRRPSPAAIVPAASCVNRTRLGRPRRICRPVLLVLPAAVVEETLRVQLSNVGSALAAELDPGELVLGGDEGQRSSRDAHTGRATDPVGE